MQYLECYCHYCVVVMLDISIMLFASDIIVGYDRRRWLSDAPLDGRYDSHVITQSTQYKHVHRATMTIYPLSLHQRHTTSPTIPIPIQQCRHGGGKQGDAAVVATY
mgnify:CR=1 FL=1